MTDQGSRRHDEKPVDAMGASPMTLRIGDPAPDFNARSTTGPISARQYKGRWILLFSHPADFTPVCTTEFLELARRISCFEARGCDLVAISVDSLFSHFAWIRAIHDKYGVEIRFPIIEDPTMVISRVYGMIADEAEDSSTVRSSFFVDPKGIVRAINSYPINVGRSVEEMLRILTALQAVDETGCLAPEGWTEGSSLLRQPESDLDRLFDADDAVSWFLAER